MAVSTVPTSVLSQQLSDAIGGRRVRCAVFTTFSLDPDAGTDVIRLPHRSPNLNAYVERFQLLPPRRRIGVRTRQLDGTDGLEERSARLETKLVLSNPPKSVDRTLLCNIAHALSWLD